MNNKKIMKYTIGLITMMLMLSGCFFQDHRSAFSAFTRGYPSRNLQEFGENIGCFKEQDSYISVLTEIHLLRDGERINIYVQSEGTYEEVQLGIYYGSYFLLISQEQETTSNQEIYFKFEDNTYIGVDGKEIEELRYYQPVYKVMDINFDDIKDLKSYTSSAPTKSMKGKIDSIIGNRYIIETQQFHNVALSTLSIANIKFYEERKKTNRVYYTDGNIGYGEKYTCLSGEPTEGNSSKIDYEKEVKQNES